MAPDRKIVIQKLDKSHHKKGFDCGISSLNEFLSRYAGQNARKGLGATYVAREVGSQKVLGYYTLSSGQVMAENLPEAERQSLPRYPIPVIRIGKLATDLRVRGQGVGKMLLIDALLRALIFSEDLGVFGIEVDALTLEAGEFYRRFGFARLLDDELHLYISIKTLKKLFA